MKNKVVNRSQKKIAILIKNILTTKIDFTNIDISQTSHEMKKMKNFTHFLKFSKMLTRREKRQNMCHTYIKIENIYFEKKRQQQLFVNINREIMKLN